MLERKEWEDLNSMVTAMYNAKNLRDMREIFMKLLNPLIYYDLCDFAYGNARKNKAPKLVDTIIRSNYSREFEEMFAKDYENKYNNVDYGAWVFSVNKSMVYKDSDLVNDELRKETIYYNEFLLKIGLPFVAGISVVKDRRFLAAITLYREESHGDFTEKDLYILEKLLPHLETILTDTKINESDLKNISVTLKSMYGLTSREIEISGRIYHGYTNEDIGNQLNISENTVKKHVYNLFDKLNVKSRSQMIHFFIENEFSELFE